MNPRPSSKFFTALHPRSESLEMPHIHDTPPPTASSTSEEERRQRIRIKNRRKLYLDRHPSYFTAPDLELADPLLYDRCIRRFQTAAEREADGKKKGYSGVLEADLYRSEAKLLALQSAPPLNPSPLSASSDSPPSPSSHPNPTYHLTPASASASDKPIPYVSYARGPNGEVLPEEEDEIPKSREEGTERWKIEMTLRFLRGEDEEFEYEKVDESEDWDVVERREDEERWFESEEPEWLGDEEGKGTSGDTGVQDF